MLSSKLVGDVTQLKQKAQAKKNLSGTGSGDKEVSPCNSNPKHRHRSQGASKAESRRESGGQSDTGRYWQSHHWCSLFLHSIIQVCLNCFFTNFFSGASVESGPQESWTGLVRQARKKSPSTLNQGSSCLNQPRARVLRGQRQEALEDGESSPAESDSSDQGEAADTGNWLRKHIKEWIFEWRLWAGIDNNAAHEVDAAELELESGPFTESHERHWRFFTVDEMVSGFSSRPHHCSDWFK